MEGKKYLQLNDIEAYKIAFSLSNEVWDIVSAWNNFAKNTIGNQFVRAIDSISANIAEGFGRYGKRDKICFYRYSYGSIKESLDWNEKAKARRLITGEQYNHIFERLQKLPRSVNHLIKFTNEKLTV
jgi:four helix bundle protein